MVNYSGIGMARRFDCQMQDKEIGFKYFYATYTGVVNRLHNSQNGQNVPDKMVEEAIISCLKHANDKKNVSFN